MNINNRFYFRQHWT